MDIRNILQDHGIEEASKATVEGDIADLEQKLTDLNQFITGAFSDGIINSIEAKKIEIYINLLRDENLKITERYNLYMDNPALEIGSSARVELADAKTVYNQRLDSLIDLILASIADGKATPEEATMVDEAYVAMMEISARLEKALDKAADYILGVRTKLAEDNAKEYADSIKAIILEDTAELAEQLRNYEGYLAGAFRDGLISEFEARNIDSYVADLTLRKTELDKRYDYLMTNTFLENNSVPRINLENAKSSYDLAHGALLAYIESAISDRKATPEEAARVQELFVNLDDKLAVLIDSIEKAVDAIAQKRADTAENLAREFAADIAGEKAQEAAEATKIYSEQLANAARVEAEAYADGIVTEEERKRIEDAKAKLKEAKEHAEAKIEEARQAQEDFVRKQITDADFATNQYIEAQRFLEKVMYQAWLDGDITEAEQAAIDEAQRRLDEAKGSADTETREAILAAKEYALKQAQEAENAATAFATLKAEEERTIAEAYADGIVTEEERKRIADVQAKLKEAKEHAEKEATEAAEAALLYSNNYTDTEIGNIRDNLVFKCEVHSTNGNVFKNGQVDTELIARVFHGANEVTEMFEDHRFRWERVSDDPIGDQQWNHSFGSGGRTRIINRDQVTGRATFNCSVLDKDTEP